MRVLYDVPVSMRDGVRLSADLYLPEGGARHPVILHRTPYNNNGATVVAEATFYVDHGYAYVAQDCRGKFDSDGQWYPYRHEAADGDDTLTWCGTQPWSSGRIGMTGSSYAAAAQWYAASTGNRYLDCLVSKAAYSDLFLDHGLRRNGVFQTYFVNWAITVAGRALFEVDRARRESAVWQVPLTSLDSFLGFDLPYWQDFVGHEAYDDLWRSLSLREGYNTMDVAVLNVAGWLSPWDFQGALTHFTELSTRARPAGGGHRQKLIVGPWSHFVNVSRKVGEFDFGDEATIDLRGVELNWFDRWLKGRENGIDREAPVRLFVMGRNIWRDEHDWPLRRTKPTAYYLHSGGRANSLLGDGLLSARPPALDEPPDRFTYNPERPVLALMTDTGQEEDLFADQRPLERRDDVLVYTTESLADDLEVTGPVTLTLYAATSTPDTDFVATLVDVQPDGVARPIMWGVQRGRYLASLSRPAALEPLRVYEWNIDLWATANVFLKGHRIRLEVSSSFFPFFGRNHNTGHPVASDAEFALAHQTIHHSIRYPSRLLLPVVGGAADPA